MNFTMFFILDSPVNTEIIPALENIKKQMLKKNDIRTVQYAMQDLRWLLLDEQDELRKEVNIQTVGRVCGPEVVTEAMDRGRKDKNITAAGCWLLGYMAANKVVGERVLSSGGLDAIVRTMKDSPRDALLQQSACYALTNLFEHSKTSEMAVRTSGGFTAFRTAKRNHPTNAFIQDLWRQVNNSERPPSSSSSRSAQRKEFQKPYRDRPNAVFHSGGISVISDFSKFTSRESLRNFSKLTNLNPACPPSPQKSDKWFSATSTITTSTSLNNTKKREPSPLYSDIVILPDQEEKHEREFSRYAARDMTFFQDEEDRHEQESSRAGTSYEEKEQGNEKIKESISAVLETVGLTAAMETIGAAARETIGMHFSTAATPLDT